MCVALTRTKHSMGFTTPRYPRTSIDAKRLEWSIGSSLPVSSNAVPNLFFDSQYFSCNLLLELPYFEIQNEDTNFIFKSVIGAAVGTISIFVGSVVFIGLYSLPIILTLLISFNVPKTKEKYECT